MFLIDYGGNLKIFYFGNFIKERFGGFMKKFNELSETARVYAWKHLLSYPEAQGLLDFLIAEGAEYILRETNLITMLRQMSLERTNKRSLNQKVLYDFSFVFHGTYEIQSLFNTIIKTVNENPMVFPSAKEIDHVEVNAEGKNIFVEVYSCYADLRMEEYLADLLGRFFRSHREAMCDTLQNIVANALDEAQFNFFVKTFQVDFDANGFPIEH